MDKATVKAHKISDLEYENILKILGREPNLLELGVFSAMWSEHCSYKSSKKYLNGFPTKAPWVIQGPGENAGVIDIGDGYAAIFKMESHNHPSFIEPYQGAATGVGGILRDVFTMGARVVANMNSLRFGNITGNDSVARHHRYLLKGCVSGIGHYGNCMGIPTVGGEISFDESFNGNILVNAFALGVCKNDEIFYAKAEGAGNSVMYVGSKTGRDGLGGAVMASDSFTDENKSLRPTVQVGDPFAEKLLLEACLELFKHDYIVGIQDMGAAGLTSSSFEMAGNSGSGMKMHLDLVPMREDKMTPYELMLSESQERMLICAKKGYEDKIKEIFNKWDLDAEVIGEVTDTGKMELFWHNELVGEIPIEPLSNSAPVLDRPTKKPNYIDEIKDIKLENFEKVSNEIAFDKLLKDVHVVNKSFVYDQYDANIQTNTIKQPGFLGASTIRVKQTKRAIAMAAECSPRHNYVNPKIGAAMAVASSGRKIAMSGAMPLAITDCLNYGNPENPEVMWQFAEGCDGIKEACKELQTPVVSGNVSLYNETDGVSVYPTPGIVSVGVNDDMTKNLPSVFNKDGVSVYIIGDTTGEFSASLYMKSLFNVVGGELKEIDYKKERAIWELVINANKKGILDFANSIGTGGIAITLAKMACLSKKGLDAKCNFSDERFIFDESFSRAVVGVLDEDKFIKMADEYKLKIQKIGAVGGDKFCLDGFCKDLNEISNVYFGEFEKIIKQDD
ncbi:phosphoribosylformylglycinamidine synthase PurLQS, PurL subunit [Campylobacter pinnipediorum subsp. caledonicus]|uniref:Phosphoribosylformylglycinamidine synthase subunit PurL n=1 Tax=Campylobacter pinnipediorum subsp. caledonicus TaxID=1874362 RepID=A0A1S6U705_9BACT|nr:phosphoribosylformylglycinamidine synthase subunit PurL [Campylobacter pinnipediorum]AQW87528.1 phosphoribosylformylglycinamidine synthase PurLQS, PurL subunit [Campylobacter pinnipediorum subsp. caledonicus]OPA72330.1 phosphoribosylformylglycinamidine synthase II [Campylobacter pinnipediorum subsp. caledonicus]